MGRRVLLSLVLAFSWTPPPVLAAAVRSHEVSLGLGGATAFEKSLFDLPLDSGSRPEAAIDLAYRQNQTPRLAWGFHLYGTEETTATYAIGDTAGGVGPRDSI